MCCDSFTPTKKTAYIDRSNNISMSLSYASLKKHDKDKEEVREEEARKKYLPRVDQVHRTPPPTPSGGGGGRT